MKQLTFYKGRDSEVRWNVTSRKKIIAEGGEGYKRISAAMNAVESLLNIKIPRQKKYDLPHIVEF